MITPEDEEKIASYWIATEREWYRQGLRKALPCDVRAGHGDPSYLISSFEDVYRYILKHAGCTYEDLKSELDLSAPVIVNNIAVLKKRGIVSSKAIGARRVMKFYIRRRVNVEELTNGQKE